MPGSSERSLRAYQRIAPFYDLIDLPFELGRYRSIRPLLFEGLSGRLMDAGVGTGRNIAFYPSGSEGVGIDLSPGHQHDQTCRGHAGRLIVRVSALPKAHGLTRRQFLTARTDISTCSCACLAYSCASARLAEFKVSDAHPTTRCGWLGNAGKVFAAAVHRAIAFCSFDQRFAGSRQLPPRTSATTQALSSRRAKLLSPLRPGRMPRVLAPEILPSPFASP